ncbi:MAG: glycosyltransferase family 2 protein [Lentisphaeria bacterium]|nr:glycosyltransferase family 2 protein [Lentisphaeria bacterium]
MDVNRKKVISIVTNCWNEVENIPLFYQRCKAELDKFPEYDYEFVVEDNYSTDGTRDVLRRIASEDKKFKVIFNANNFGHIRSPFNCLLSSSGDVVFYLCSDLQEPPEMLSEFMAKYHEGYRVVCGVRSGTRANIVLEFMRGVYYSMLQKFSANQEIIQKFTGFGLYDRCFIDALRQFKEPYPYFRGLVSEIGFKRCEVPFIQAAREHGVTKNNFFTLYDMAMTGFVNHTKLPLRLAIFSGFVIGIFSVLIAFAYLIAKLIWWDTFNLGLAPLVVGMFFIGAVQLFFIGIIGEYIGAIYTQVKNKPLVIVEEKLNFPDGQE